MRRSQATFIVLVVLSTTHSEGFAPATGTLSSTRKIVLSPSKERYSSLSKQSKNGLRRNVDRQRTCPSSVSERTLNTKLFMSMEPLAKEGNWAAYFDEENTGLVYYFNGETGESVWTPPSSTFPTVELTQEQLKIMQEKNNGVNVVDRGVAQLEDVASATASFGSGFFSSIRDALKEGEKRQRELNEERAQFQAALVEAERAQKAAAKEAREAAAKEAREAEQKKETERQKAAKAMEKKEASAKKGIGGLLNAMTITTSTKNRKMDDPDFVSEDLLKDTGSIKTTPLTFPTISIKSPFGQKLDPDLIVPSAKPMTLDVGSVVMASPEKISWGGEDAVFVQGRTFGVFDGVSGATKEPGIELYSRALARNMKLQTKNEGLTIGELSKKLLYSAEYADEKATGASTALVASIGEDDILRVLNVGDCVTLVIREGKVVARTKEISHYFDCPYQLSIDSPDRPKDGTKLLFQLMTGDIIVSASDGVSDNLTDDDICSIVGSSSATSSMQKPSLIAKAIATESRRVSLDNKAPTPYAILAKKNKYEDYMDGVGGKLDDISCVAIRCI